MPTRPKHGFTGPSPVQRGSAKHVALGVLKVYNTPVTPQDLVDFNKAMFKTPSRARDLLTFLKRKNWATEIDGGFRLSEEGYRVLVEVGARNPYRGSFD